MPNIVVCIKQVPMVSELPWDKTRGTLKREAAEGMMDPASKHALEAALTLKYETDAHITILSMGPPMAEEAIREAIAMGADRGILLTDPRMAGADTSVTSATLARTIEKYCTDFDVIICGCRSADSETGQVGPQLAEELRLPCAGYIETIEYQGRHLQLQRLADNFMETLEMDLPGLVTLSMQSHAPRYVPLAGIEEAFGQADIVVLNADDLELDPEELGLKASPTKIVNIYSPQTEKQNIILKGPPKKIIDEVFEKYADLIGGAIGKDLKLPE